MILGLIAGAVSLAKGDDWGTAGKKALAWGISPVLGAGYSAYSAGLLTSPENKAADDQLQVADHEKTARQQSYDHARRNESLQWTQAIEQANQRATETETAAKLGFQGTAEQTYMGNLQAAAGLADMAQQNTAALGELQAANAMAGMKSNQRYSEITSAQLAERSQLAQSSLERGTKAGMTQAKGQLDIALTSAANLRNSFAEGGSQFKLYQQRLASMDSAFRNNESIQSLQYNHLQDMYDQTSLDFTKRGGGFNWNALWNWGSLGFNTFKTAASIGGQVAGMMG